MKILQNVLIALTALLILAGLFTEGWVSVAFSTAGATVAVLALAFTGGKKQK